MFGQPVTMITQPVAGFGQRNGFSHRLGGVAVLADRRLVENGQKHRIGGIADMSVGTPLTTMAHAVRVFFKKPRMNYPTDVISLPKNVPQGSSGVLSLDQIESPIVRQGLDYWLK